MVDEIASQDKPDIPSLLLSLDAFQLAIDAPWITRDKICRLLILPVAYWQLCGLTI